MANYDGITFTKRTVQLANNSFTQCTFTQCVFEYDGSSPMVLVDCELDAPRFVFTGHALNTLRSLSDFYGSAPARR